MIKKLEIGIIGSGVFGLSIACKLSSIAKNIDVYEREEKILNGATRYNHNRHHAGYHYPRSSATVDQCRLSNESFFSIYKNALDFKFRNFYVISKNDSRITTKRFESFCKLHDLLPIGLPLFPFHFSCLKEYLFLQENSHYPIIFGQQYT